MHQLPSHKFDHTGVFEGFIRNDEGKRRLILKLRDNTRLEFKVEKGVRKEFEDELVPGALITVAGFQEPSLKLQVKRIIKRIRVLFSPPRPPAACEKCPIHVCAKKNCWKSGGKELMQQLKERVVVAGLEDVVDLRPVRCLDQCKRAPAIEFGKKILTRCSSETIDRIVEELVDRNKAQH